MISRFDVVHTTYKFDSMSMFDYAFVPIRFDILGQQFRHRHRNRQRDFFTKNTDIESNKSEIDSSLN